MTRAQLAVKVLSKIGKHDQGSVVGPADFQNVSDTYDGVYQILKDDGLVMWGASDDIPTKYTQAIIQIVASQLKPDYRVPMTPVDALPIPKHPGTLMLRRQLASPYVPTITPIESF